MPIPTDFRVDGRSLVRPALIETGYYRGATVAAALAAGFQSVDSIEYDVKLFRAGVFRWAGEGRVHLHRGPSPDLIAGVADPALPTTLYLDAHFCGDHRLPPEPKYGQCPLLAELDAVWSVPWRAAPILAVDDWHMFRRPWDADLARRFDERQWPEAEDVLARLRGRGYGFVHTEFVLYAFPD